MEKLFKRCLFFLLTIALPLAVLGQTPDTCIAQSQSQKAVHVVILGSSTAAGVGAWPENSGYSWAEIFTANLKSKNPSNKVTNLARGGYTLNSIMPTSHPYGDWPSPDPERNITKAINLKPDAIIIAMASNDAASNRSVSRQLNQFKEIIDSAKISKIPVWVITTQPRKFAVEELSKYSIQEKMQDTLKDIHGVYCVDFWSGMSRPDPSLPGSIYLTKKYYNSDSIHFNNSGHSILAQRIIAKDILTSLTVAQDKNVIVVQSPSCGQPSSVQIQQTQAGIRYYLKKDDGTLVAGPLTGDGTTKSFSIANSGNYKIVANNEANNCQRELSTSISIHVSPNSPQQKTISALAAFVHPGGSTKIRIPLSETGVIYQLKDLAGTNYEAGAGTGANLDLSTGTLTESKEFKVIAEKNGCVIVMANTVRVEVDSSSNTSPIAEILSPVVDFEYAGGQTISFSGSGKDQEDGSLGATAFKWKVELHKGTTVTPGPSIASGIKTGTFVIPSTGETDHRVFYRLLLTVTDSKNASHTVARDLLPIKATIKIETEPAGLKAKIDNNVTLTPYEGLGVVGVKRTLGVVEPQMLNGKNYVFSHWQHGGNPNQMVTTPLTGGNYKAIYIEGVAAPIISTQPISKVVNAGQSATFTVSATGVGTLTYQWQKDGVNISGATTASYTIANAQSSKAGSYRVLVRNAGGTTISNSALLTVVTPPAIVTQPSAVTIAVGLTATFSVNATGSAPLSYQWRKDGINIPGATSSTFSIINVQPSHQGLYRVVITNAAGSATSHTAPLTVTAPNDLPVATIETPLPNSFYRGGQTISYSGTATDSEDGSLPASAYNWKVELVSGTTVSAGPTITSGVKSGTFVIPSSGVTSPNVLYRISLTVQDSKGGTNMVSRDINPYKRAISINTQPSGIKVLLDNQQVATPYSGQSVEGVQRTLGVVSPQQLNGKTYLFSHWVHGGSASQTFTTPAADVSFTAVFVEDQAPSLNGLNYSYFLGTWSQIPDYSSMTPIKSGIVENLDLTPRTQENYFGFSFTGFIDIPTTATYTFILKSDDGAKLYIDNNVIIDLDGNHAAWERPGTVTLSQGKHAFKINYFDKEFDQVLELRWERPGVARQLVPSTAYFLNNSSKSSTALKIQKEAAVSAQKEGEVTVYPNPSPSQLNVSLSAAKGQEVHFSVFDKFGKKVFEKIAVAELNGINKFCLEHSLNKDSYVLKIVKDNRAISKHFYVN